jgi:hypothetical protein
MKAILPKGNFTSAKLTASSLLTSFKLNKLEAPARCGRVFVGCNLGVSSKFAKDAASSPGLRILNGSCVSSSNFESNVALPPLSSSAHGPNHSRTREHTRGNR